MEKETFCTGYCRALDQSRMVTAEKEDGQWYVDCNYGSCPYEDRCTIAKELKELP